MSAGICIMNKKAIAMAADSAVTIGQHDAIHNSANKLFALSKYEPVGAIIYANAEFMRIPMEIIIKEYKRDIGKKAFTHLKDYVDHFVEYLQNNTELFRFANNEQHYVCQVYLNLLNGLKNGYERFIKEKLEAVQRELTPEELQEIAVLAYNETMEYIDAQKNIPSAAYAQYIKDNYYDLILKYIGHNFQWLTKEQQEAVANKVCLIYDKDFYRNGYLGIAIAGFGRSDIFPQMFHLHLGGIINGKVRYSVRENVVITEGYPAAINPFAQTDVMQTFLFGINDSLIDDMAKEIPTQIDNKIKSLDDGLFAEGKKDTVQQALLTTTPSIVHQIAVKANQRYMQPILQSVATLPVEEMAMLAESMINITSLRRKVAIDGNMGTVGGPIDVAIISKGDGLVWMKRKHYFDLAHNLQYAFTRYMDSSNDSRSAIDGQDE